jgi:site-specific DNA-methyltransferase (adenine-specific)
MNFGFHNIDGLSMLKEIDSNSIDLVLTDPPYIISKESGMNKVFEDKEVGIVKAKYGTKYAIQTDYGDWDSKFTIETLEQFIKEFYRVLKKGGTCIIFFDLWKIETLSNILNKNGFSKIRMIEWIKTNPVPINSKATYLNNAREIALTCVKGAGQVFNSKYDTGIYNYPIYRGIKGIDRIHPTQKSLELFVELIKKHSKDNSIVIDPFGGSGTTYLASQLTNRNCYSSEVDKKFFDMSMTRIKWHETNTIKKESPKEITFFDE